MKTICPGCRTVFRINPDQLRARSGRVRCGRCHTVFNALDDLCDDAAPLASPAEPSTPAADRTAAPTAIDLATTSASATGGRSATDARQDHGQPEADAAPLVAASTFPAGVDDARPSPRPENENARQEKHWLGETRRQPKAAISRRREAQLLGAATALLAFLLAGQLIFLLRGAISLAVPGLQPSLAALCEIVGSEIPLPRRADLLTIEASDLQSEPGRATLLTLQTTVRNQARYAQAYPAIELSLTDINDKVIARRVLFPAEYLAPSAPEASSFAAGSAIDVRLRLETRPIEAAGYRLYLFYP